jgi:hypothetical protein
MSSEWMKVMLDEIARKQAEGEQERLELERRRGDAGDMPRGDGTCDVPRGEATHDVPRGDAATGARGSG